MNAVTFYYVIGSIVALIGVAGGSFRLYHWQKMHWTQEGEDRAEQAEQAAATKRNSEKLEENTNAITVLTQELREFVLSVRMELNGHEGRITKLERWKEQYYKVRSRSERGDEDA